MSEISRECSYNVIFCFNVKLSIFNYLDPIVVFPTYYSLFFHSFDSMARTKLTPKKEREGRSILIPRSERVKIAKKGRRPPSPVHHPSPARKPSTTWEVEKTVEEAEKWVSLHHHHQPDSWPRWLWRPGHLLWERSQLRGSSALPWEAKPPRRNSLRLDIYRSPGSTGLAQLPSGRSGSFKRALSSLFRNSPSHG